MRACLSSPSRNKMISEKNAGLGIYEERHYANYRLSGVGSRACQRSLSVLSQAEKME